MKSHITQILNDIVKQYPQYKLELNNSLEELNMYDLHSFYKNICLCIQDEDYWQDNSIRLDYVFLDDGMLAWNMQFNYKLIEENQIEDIFKIIVKIFRNETILLDEANIKPLRKGCNFEKEPCPKLSL